MRNETDMKNIIIFGDSYSTFEGYIPKNYETYYPTLNVHSVEETWWKQFIQKTDCNLVQNNSWSGSTIGYTGYNNMDCSHSSSFIYRYRKLKEEGFFKTNTLDMVFVFGGTNDSWSDAPLGEMKFAHWKEKDFFYVLPAICYLAYMLKIDLPNAEIIFIINTQIKEEIQNGIEEAAKYYGLKFIRLQNIDKEIGHPTTKGMTEICEQVISIFKKKNR